jgi:MerR family transcriptional regulator, light-induced transcriptional regulator
VMHAVGERWHEGTLSIAQEHMMSGLVQQLLGTLMGFYRPAPGAPKLIFTTVEGELHSLGVLAAAMLAAGAGLSPIFLGPSLPPAEIVQAARRSGSRALVLQVTDPSDAVAAQIRRLREDLPAPVELWLGGPVEFEVADALVFADFSGIEEHYRRLAA